MGEPEEGGLVSPDDLAGDQQPVAMRMQDLAGALQGAAGWRPACANCVNEHELAIMAVSKKLIAAGIGPGSPEFAQAMQNAVALGQMLMQNPFALQGMNGAKPDVIPAVRPADMFVNGTTCCAICFTPGMQSSLTVAPAGWTPGRTGR